MAIAISVSNQKGGTSKSTLCSTLAAWLARLGYKVLMVDMDPQGHLSSLTGTPKADGIFELLTLGKALHEVIIPIDAAYHEGEGWLGLLPGYNKTQTAAIDMQIQGHDYGLLDRTLAPLRDGMDFILFDNSPTVSLFTPSILMASDYVLIPTRMMTLDLNGVDEIVQIMANLARLHTAKLLGIVPTQTTPQTKEYRLQMMDLKEKYGELVWDDCQTTLSTVWAEASAVARPVFVYHPEHQATQQAQALGRKVLEMIGAHHV
jgi:chromosome partitioning protein